MTIKTLYDLHIRMNRDILQSSKDIKKAYKSLQSYYAEVKEEQVVAQTSVGKTNKEKQLE